MFVIVNPRAVSVNRAAVDFVGKDDAAAFGNVKRQYRRPVGGIDENGVVGRFAGGVFDAVAGKFDILAVAVKKHIAGSVYGAAQSQFAARNLVADKRKSGYGSNAAVVINRTAAFASRVVAEAVGRRQACDIADGARCGIINCAAAAGCRIAGIVAAGKRFAEAAVVINRAAVLAGRVADKINFR